MGIWVNLKIIEELFLGSQKQQEKCSVKELHSAVFSKITTPVVVNKCFCRENTVCTGEFKQAQKVLKFKIEACVDKAALSQVLFLFLLVDKDRCQHLQLQLCAQHHCFSPGTCW